MNASPGIIFPSMKNAKQITIDLETHDPELKTKGPGVRRGGYIVGAAISVDGAKAYYPVAHNVGPNHDQAQVYDYMRRGLRDYTGDLLFTNGLYDLDYMAEQNIVAPKAMNRDVQIAEPLLKEDRKSYALEILGHHYVGEGKREAGIAEAYGKDWKSRMRDIDSRVVGSYAIGDLDLPERIHAIQLEKLAEEDMLELYDMECRLTPLLLQMRRMGVRVDLDAAERLSNQFYIRQKEVILEIKRLSGVEVNINSADDLAKCFDKLDLKYPRTEKTKKPSFTKDWLEYHPHPVCELIREARKLGTYKGTFIDSYILNGHLKGRLHTQFHQVASDEGGTVTGRFSSSNPNLQNIPARDPVYGPLIRALFLPDEGCDWYSRDWSQIEYRLLVHYSAKENLPGARDAQRLYNDVPDTDYHNLVAGMTGLPRKDAKNINFGIVYGMGVDKLARSLGRTREEAEPILEQYHTQMPFPKAFLKAAARAVSARGYVRTMLKRRRRFNQWESAKWYTAAERLEVEKEKGADWFFPTEDRDLAEQKWGRIRRAKSHKAGNAVIQGSAADMMKKAMVEIWEAGYCVDAPVQLTVHDELNGSIDGSPASREALAGIHRVMETCMPLTVPIRADGTEGANWAIAKG